MQETITHQNIFFIIIIIIFNQQESSRFCLHRNSPSPILSRCLQPILCCFIRYPFSIFDSNLIHYVSHLTLAQTKGAASSPPSVTSPTITSVGSIPSVPLPVTQPLLQEFNPSSYRVYASVCPKEQGVSNQLECYDPSSNTWGHVGPTPEIIENHVLKDFAKVSLRESVYIIGGRVCNKRKLCTSGECNDFVDCSVEVSPMVLRYNVRSGQWSKWAPMQIPRYEFACTVCDNKIYVAGGKSDLASGRGISSAEMYDPAVDMWTPLPNMSTMRYKCVGMTWQGKIHVVGGFVERKESYPMITFIKERSSAEVFGTLTGKWELVAGMWQLDVPPNQIVEMDGRLFSSGDRLKAWKGHIEVYDVKLNMWDEVEGSRCQILNSPICDSGDTENWAQMQGMYLMMAPIGTQLYFLAGFRIAGEVSRTVSMAYIFDTAATSNAWRSFEPTEEDREKELCSHCCVVKLS